MLLSKIFETFHHRQLLTFGITAQNDPTGIRTPVAAVKGRCPRPLDDGAVTPQRMREKFRYPEDSRQGFESRVLCKNRLSPEQAQKSQQACMTPE